MTVRVGFLGGGFIARYHVDMLRRAGADVEIVAVHDPDADKAAGFERHSGAAVLASEDAVIEASDAVYVAAWTASHPHLVAMVASAGKPVFCEKPLATHLGAALEMVNLVERAGIVNQVGLVLRDSPAFLYLKHLIDRPASGRVMSIVFRDDQYLPINGLYGSTWRADPIKAGAGTLLEHSIHDVDLLEWIFGPVATVAGTIREMHGIAGIDDVAVATLDFASGAVGSLTSVWHDVLARPSQRRVEVFCERAWYALEGDVNGPVRWMCDGAEGHNGDGRTSEGALEGAALVAALAEQGIVARNPDQAFIDAVSTGKPAYPSFADALRPQLLVDAIYRSARSGVGAPVPVAPAVLD